MVIPLLCNSLVLRNNVETFVTNKRETDRLSKRKKPVQALFIRQLISYDTFYKVTSLASMMQFMIW